jgi:hypothetical protein
MEINAMGHNLYFGKKMDKLTIQQKIYQPKWKFCFKLAESNVIFLTRTPNIFKSNGIQWHTFSSVPVFGL